MTFCVTSVVFHFQNFYRRRGLRLLQFAATGAESPYPRSSIPLGILQNEYRDNANRSLRSHGNHAPVFQFVIDCNHIIICPHGLFLC